MQLTNPADGNIVAPDARATPRPKAAQRIGLEAQLAHIAREREHALDVPFHVIEIERLTRAAPLLRPARTGGDAGERLDLAKRAARHVELIADLEQPHPALLTAHVVAARRDEAAPERDAHFAELRRNGIRQSESPRLVKQQALQRRIDERVSDRLPIATVGHRREHPIVRQSRLGGVAGYLRSDSVRLGDAVEAAQARNLLDQIFLDAYVEAMRGRQYAPALLRGLHPLADRPQDFAYLPIRHMGTQQPREAAATQPHPLLGCPCLSLCYLHG